MVIDVPILFHAFATEPLLPLLMALLLLLLLLLLEELATPTRTEAARRLASSLCIGNGSLPDILMGAFRVEGIEMSYGCQLF